MTWAELDVLMTADPELHVPEPEKPLSGDDLMAEAQRLSRMAGG